MRPAPDCRNHFLSRLSQTDLALLAPHLTAFDMRVGEYLHRTGEPVDHVVFPTEGVVAIVIGAGKQPTIEAALIGQEGIIGGLSAAAGLPAMSDARIRVPGRAYRVPAEAFRDALDVSARMRSLAQRYESAAIAQIQQSALCNAAHSVEARICRWLLEIHDRCEGDRVPLTQDALAQMIGVRRTTVTLVAAKLQQAGAFRCRRGLVYLSGRELLERHSCACYGRMQKLTKDLFPEHPGSATPLRQPRAQEHGAVHTSLMAEP
jgi:CRP-like cAMP-binding protein